MIKGEILFIKFMKEGAEMKLKELLEQIEIECGKCIVCDPCCTVNMIRKCAELKKID